MQLYLDIITFNFFRFLAYPFEILGNVGKRSFSIVFLILFWSIIGRYSSTKINIHDITGYFLIASSVNSFVMAEYTVFGDWINMIIRIGDLNNYMIRPIPLLPYLYSTYVGRIGLRLSFSFITLILGLLVTPPQSFASILLFFVFLFLAMIISFSLNIIVGVLGFYVTDPSGIRYAVGHFISILSGAAAPLSFFPEGLRNIVLLTPFPYLIFGPINALKMKTIDGSVLSSLGIASVWAVILFFFALIAWQKGIKKYEAIGI